MANRYPWDRPVHQQEREGHHVAQICINGHVVNESFSGLPQFNQDFCDQCGKRTITACSSRNISIRGRSLESYSGTYEAPQHCYRCGNAFPWTEANAAAALGLFIELLEIKQEDEREELKRNLGDICVEGPRTEVAAVKIKRTIDKAGKAVGGMLRDATTKVATGVAVKIITGF